jgi:hypothetical protein
MIGYARSHRNGRSQARASARGPGVVMLAVDELALRVEKNDSATALKLLWIVKSVYAAWSDWAGVAAGAGRSRKTSRAT